MASATLCFFQVRVMPPAAQPRPQLGLWIPGCQGGLARGSCGALCLQVGSPI